MKKVLLALTLLCGLAATASGPEADPVLVTVAGREIRLSEFEYLYNKSSSQFEIRQSPQEYFELFLTYRLKVADALAAGIDTTASFRNEYEVYRRDLARPFMEDADTRRRILEEAYARSLEDVDVSHIMLDRGSSRAENLAARELLDSLRNEIIAGHADFDSMAVKYSVDREAVIRGTGRMGSITDNGFIPSLI